MLVLHNNIDSVFVHGKYEGKRLIEEEYTTDLKEYVKDGYGDLNKKHRFVYNLYYIFYKVLHDLNKYPEYKCKYDGFKSIKINEDTKRIFIYHKNASVRMAKSVYNDVILDIKSYCKTHVDLYLNRMLKEYKTIELDMLLIELDRLYYVNMDKNLVKVSVTKEYPDLPKYLFKASPKDNLKEIDIAYTSIEAAIGKKTKPLYIYTLKNTNFDMIGKTKAKSIGEPEITQKYLLE